MELAAVKTSYRHWAPIYDHTFGRITQTGRRRAVAEFSWERIARATMDVYRSAGSGR